MYLELEPHLRLAPLPVLVLVLLCGSGGAMVVIHVWNCHKPFWLW